MARCTGLARWKQGFNKCPCQPFCSWRNVYQTPAPMPTLPPKTIQCVSCFYDPGAFQAVASELALGASKFACKPFKKGTLASRSPLAFQDVSAAGSHSQMLGAPYGAWTPFSSGGLHLGVRALRGGFCLEPVSARLAISASPFLSILS